MKIRTRILIQTLSASLALTVLLGAVFFVSVAEIRRTALANSGELGSNAANISADALENQLTQRIDRIARDAALILGERLGKIESHTRMVANITGLIYTDRQGRQMRPLPRVLPGEITPREPFLYVVPGVDFSSIRAEAELAGNIDEMIRQIAITDQGIVTSSVAAETGFVLMMDARPSPMTAFDPRTLRCFEMARASGNPYWTDIYEDKRGRGPVISCTIPFFEQSGANRIFRGVSRSTVLLSDFSSLIDFSALGSSGRIFILNRNGIMIYSSFGVEVMFRESAIFSGKNFLESPDRRLRSLGTSMTLGAFGMTELEMEGVPVYVAYAPIQTLGWSLAVTVPVQEIFASIQRIENQIWRITEDTRADMNRHIFFSAGLIAALLFFAILGITWAAFRFSGAITGPILALNDGVHEVSIGNLDKEVVVNTGDELEELAVSFNMTTERLRNYVDEIAKSTAEKQRIATELEIATTIQMSMLPADFPPFSGRKNEFDLYANMYPAKEVGGDFYDFFFIDDNRFAFLIADVSGKGIPAALFMAITKAIIKNHLQSGEDPRLALEIINRQLCGNNSTDTFVTLWLGVLEIPSGRIEYINAGHTPPLIKRGDGDFEFLVSPADLVLAGLDDTVYHSRKTFLGGGDTLFLYTDGITDAADSEGGFYGNERLKNFLNAAAALPLNEMIHGLRADIASFAASAEQWDDITMLAIRTRTDSQTKKITLKADVAELETLNAFIGRELDASGCFAWERSRIELAVEEIFVNIARYAYNGTVCGETEGEEHIGEVTVDCRIVLEGSESMTVFLGFTDYGVPFNPAEYKEPDITLPVDKREIGGLGLLIIKKNVDTIHYRRENGSNRLEISKKCGRESY